MQDTALETEREYWNQRYSSGRDSGYGSYGEQLARKLGWLRRLTGVRTITEVGCGDFNFGKNVVQLFPGSAYLGLDVSDEIVKRNREAFPEHFFGIVGDDIPAADLLMCVDVLFHIYDDVAVQELFDRLAASWRKYLVLSAYEYDGLRQHQIRIRKFEPMLFGRPMLRETVEEDGDLKFYIFEK